MPKRRIGLIPKDTSRPPQIFNPLVRLDPSQVTDRRTETRRAETRRRQQITLNRTAPRKRM